MELEYRLVQVGDLKPYGKNSRRHSDEQIDQVARSIREFGFLNPIIIDGQGGVIAGHCRLMAAKRMGIDQVPVIEAGHLTEAQQRAYIIADNKIAEGAEWDSELLRVEIRELMGLDFDLSLTGFLDDELDKILGEQEEIQEREEELISITWTRMMISIPNGAEIEGMDSFLEKIESAGGRVDYGGN